MVLTRRQNFDAIYRLLGRLGRFAPAAPLGAKESSGNMTSNGGHCFNDATLPRVLPLRNIIVAGLRRRCENIAPPLLLDAKLLPPLLYSLHGAIWIRRRRRRGPSINSEWDYH